MKNFQKLTVRDSFLAGARAELRIVDVHGEVTKVSLEPGWHSAATYWGAGEVFTNGVVAPRVDRRSQSNSLVHYQSAANPDYRPTDEDRMIRNMELRMRRQELELARSRKRQRAIERAQAERVSDDVVIPSPPVEEPPVETPPVTPADEA